MLTERKHIEGEAREVIRRCGEVPVYTADLDVLTQMTGYSLTRGMLCAMRRPPLPTVEEVCRGARRIAVLENVVNPTNVGAIFRSAAALGMDAVLHSRLQQPALPAFHTGEYGNGISGSLDVSGRERKLARRRDGAS